MKDKIAKILKKGINPFGAAVVCAAICLILLVPTVYLGKYNFMKADDYSYGRVTHNTFVQTGSVIETIKAAIDTVKTTYDTWQGTFSSVFLMSLHPGVFDYRLYKLVPAMMISMILIANFLLTRTLICKVLGNKKSYWIITASLLSIMMIERMYTVPGALFWYNAAVHYIFAQCCFFILADLYIRLAVDESKIKKAIMVIVSIFLAVEVGGSNYGTILIASVALLSLEILLLAMKKRGALLALPSLIIEITGMILNAAAPGNNVRGAYYEGCSALTSILMSFKSIFEFTIKWTDVFTVVILVMLIPVFWNCTGKTNFKFKFWYLVLLYSICVTATGFTSSYFSMGNEGLSRTQNVIKMTWQILLLVNECYIIGWIRSKWGKKDMNLSLAGMILCFLLLLLPPALLKNLGTITSYTSFEYLYNRQAQSSWVENMERLDVLTNPEITDPILKPHTFKPFYLYVSDITEDPSNWENQAMAGFYGKNSVTLGPEEERDD